MIRVTIELIPFGNEARKRVLGTMVLVNDGTGSAQTGNYNCFLVRKDGNPTLYYI